MGSEALDEKAKKAAEFLKPHTWGWSVLRVRGGASV